MTTHDTGTLILQGIVEGAGDGLTALYVAVSAGVSALIIGGMLAFWLILRIEAQRAKAERARVFTIIETKDPALEAHGDVVEIRKAA